MSKGTPDSLSHRTNRWALYLLEAPQDFAKAVVDIESY